MLKKVGVAVGRSPDDSLELILRGGFGKGAAVPLPPPPPPSPLWGVSRASGP